MKLWIDDIRPMPAQYDVHIKSAQLAKQFIASYWSDLELVSFDHDAGDYASQGGDYIKVIDWLDEMEHMMGYHVPFKVHFHTGNPIGLRTMEQVAARDGWDVVDDDETMDSEDTVC